MTEINTLIFKKPNANKNKLIIKPSWILHAILTIHRKKRDKFKSLRNENFTILNTISSLKIIIKTVSYRLAVWFGMGGFLHAFCKTEFQHSYLKVPTNTEEILRKTWTFYTTDLNYRSHGQYEQFYSLELKIPTWLSSKHTLWKTKHSNNCWPGIKIFCTAFGPYNCFHILHEKI